MSKDRPYVVDGALTKWFWLDCDAADSQARDRIADMPKCQLCGAPMCCGQLSTHHVCAEGQR